MITVDGRNGEEQAPPLEPDAHWSVKTQTNQTFGCCDSMDLAAVASAFPRVHFVKVERAECETCANKAKPIT